MSGYDPPPVVPGWTPVNPRPFSPLQLPPEPLTLPLLPSAPRQSTFSNSWAVSTHIIPAAYPRVSPDVPLPGKLPESLNKDERRRMSSDRATELVKQSIEHSTSPNSREGSKVLWNCVNRYVKKGGRTWNGLTLFFAHANGFCKEIWEPALDHMLSHGTGLLIDEIWTWEAVQHGDSALINKDNLSGIFDWRDNGRDIFNFLVNYLPASPTTSTLPTHLLRLPAAETETRKITGYKERTLVAVGHSFGGTTTALVAINYPALFSSLILVDPITSQPHILGGLSTGLNRLVNGALQRREHWPSREEALRLFKLIPFFAAWDPEVLKKYVEHALTPDPNGGFRLKMSGIQEAIVFADSYVAYEVWELIDRLDERIELRYIMPGKVELPGGEAHARIAVWRRRVNTSNIRISNAGHLIPHEAPKEFAEELRNFIQRKYETLLTKL